MGYRSDVAIVFNKKAMEVMPQDVKDELEALAGEDGIIMHDDGELTEYRITYVKWYSDYEDVKKIEGFLDMLGDEWDKAAEDDCEPPEYEFLRIGEDEDDTEHRWNGNGTCRLWVNRTIEFSE